MRRSACYAAWPNRSVPRPSSSSPRLRCARSPASRRRHSPRTSCCACGPLPSRAPGPPRSCPPWRCSRRWDGPRRWTRNSGTRSTLLYSPRWARPRNWCSSLLPADVWRVARRRSARRRSARQTRCLRRFLDCPFATAPLRSTRYCGLTAWGARWRQAITCAWAGGCSALGGTASTLHRAQGVRWFGSHRPSRKRQVTTASAPRA
mmetsp:Transcript_37393/g.93001  ORF Transcript_37393/g.93001 Transcript_37393/m.93001 type:complete len:205 (-) Transcript_37393:2459-3073(-)